VLVPGGFGSIAIVRAAARELSQLDKDNASAYAANAGKAVTALKALDADLRRQLGPLKGKRFPLRELPPTMGRYEDEPDISCSAACEFVEGSDVWDELREENIW
jgi:hypothetical protein